MNPLYGYNDERNPLCGCGKVAFDKKGAQTKRNALMKHGRERLRIYQCPYSQMWHLSKEYSRNGYHE